MRTPGLNPLDVALSGAGTVMGAKRAVPNVGWTSFAAGMTLRRRRPLNVMPDLPLLEIRDLQLDFRIGDGWARAVDGLSLTVNAGETLCLVGESGCGKSVTALS